MIDVFISYSRKDIAFARILHASLAENELETWIDWQDIPPSVDWLAEVYEAIEKSETFIFIISETSVTSEICKLEIEHAVKHNKRVIPIVINEIDPGVIPPALAALNWIFFRDEDPFKRAVNDLIEAIRTDYDWVQEHTRILNRALDWERGGGEAGALLRGRDLQEAESWLLKAPEKKPEPTPLHTQYILTSRQQTARQQRTVLGAVLGVFGVVVVLGLVAWWQRNVAVREETVRATAAAVAMAEAEIRGTAEAEAVSESLVRATAQVVAEAQREVAVQERDVVLSRQLAAQARVHMERPDLALLLGMQSSQFADTREARASLWEAFCSRPQLRRILHGGEEVARGKAVSIALSPNGDLIAAGNEDGSVQMWSVESEKLLGGPLTGHPAPVEALAFSPDGETLVSVSVVETATVIRWDISRGERLAEPLKLALPGGEVERLALGLGGNLLALASANSVSILDLNAGSQVGDQLLFPGWALRSLAFSPNGALLAAGYERMLDGAEENSEAKGAIVLWEVESSSMLMAPITSEEFVSGITSLAFRSDGTVLASGSLYEVEFDRETPARGRVRIWDVTTGEQISYGTLVHTSAVMELTFSPDGAWLASSDGETIALHWRKESGEYREWLEFLAAPAALPLTFIPGEDMLASAGPAGGIYLWDLEDRESALQHRFDLIDRQNHLAFSPGGEWLASGGCGRNLAGERCSVSEVRLWDPSSYEPVGEPMQSEEENLMVLAVSPDGSEIATGHQSGKVFLWDIASGQVQEVGSVEEGWEVRALTFSPGGEWLIAGGDGFYGDDTTLALWETDTGNVAKFIKDEVGTVNSLDFEPRLGLLAVGGVFISDWPGLAWLDPTTGALDRYYFAWPNSIREGTQVNSLDISPDGSLLAAGLSNWTVHFWDVATGQIFGLPLEVFEDDVTSVAFSPDGRLLASGDQDGNLYLWDVATLERLGDPLNLDQFYITDLIFSPDGSRLVVAVSDEFSIWEMDLPAWRHRACLIAGRGLSPGEWSTYVGELPYEAACQELP
jgi:WD40 repeat protein